MFVTTNKNMWNSPLKNEIRLLDAKVISNEHKKKSLGL